MFPRDLHKNGFVFLPQFQPHETASFVAASIGTIAELPGVSVTQRIRPKRTNESTPNLYSGNFGLDEFPLHTDLAHWYLPPRYLLLRCVCPAPEVNTLILHNDKALCGFDLLTLDRAFYRPRRKLSGRLSLLRLRQNFMDGVIFRWDQLFLKPANDEGALVANHLKSPSLREEATRISFNYTFDTLIVDNWAVLHGRSPVPKTALSRVVDRVYLKEIW